MLEKLQEMIFGKPYEEPPECEVMCPKHHYALEACGKCMEEKAYHSRDALFLRALFIVGLCALLSIVYGFMTPAVQAYKNIENVKAEYAHIWENYTCTMSFRGGNHGCLMGGYYYPTCPNMTVGGVNLAN